MEKKIKKVLAYPGPIICDINAVRNLAVSPKLMAKKLPNGQFASPRLKIWAHSCLAKNSKKHVNSAVEGVIF